MNTFRDRRAYGCGYECDRYGTTTIIKKIYLGGRRRGYRRRYRPPRVRQYFTPVPVPVPVPGPTVVISPPVQQPLWAEYANYHKYGCDTCQPPPMPSCDTGNCGAPVPAGPPPPMPGPGCTTGTCGGGGYQPPPVPPVPAVPPPMPSPGCATGTCGGGYQPPPVPPPVPGCATGSCPPPVPGGCATGTCGGGGYPPYGVMAAKAGAPGALVPSDVPEQAMQPKQNT
ncbi:hypothetical protein Y032_0357g3371 [Ancylostoma ceylanicum]|nr:hypothetical protein Y032_0357g3371 [Ancylostoma ceylanicum]